MTDEENSGVVRVLAKLKELDTKMDAVITAVKEVPYLAKKIGDLESVASDLSRIVLQAKTVPAPPPPPEPEPYYILAAEIIADEDEEDDPDDDTLYFVGVLSKPIPEPDGVPLHAGHWDDTPSEAVRFRSPSEASVYFDTMLKNRTTGLRPQWRWKITAEKRTPVVLGKTKYAKPVTHQIAIQEKQS